MPPYSFAPSIEKYRWPSGVFLQLPHLLDDHLELCVVAQGHLDEGRFDDPGHVHERHVRASRLTGFGRSPFRVLSIVAGWRERRVAEVRPPPLP